MVKKGFFKYIGVVPLLTIATIMVLSGSYIYKSNFISNIQGLRKVTNGLHICFSRVQQTYTSSLLGLSNSPYLENKFFMDTEECFGEVVNTLDSEVRSKFNVISKSLNSLGKEIHWFHNKIEFKDGKLVKGSGFALDRRFSSLEDMFDKLTERIDRRVTSQEQSASRLSLLIDVLMFAVILFIGYWVYDEYSIRRKSIEIDEIAAKELERENINPSKVLDLLKKKSSLFNSSTCEELVQKMNMEAFKEEREDLDDLSELLPPQKRENSPVTKQVIEEVTEVEDLATEKTDEKVIHVESNDYIGNKEESIWETLEDVQETYTSVGKREKQKQEEAADNIESVNLDKSLAESVKILVGEFFRAGIEIDFRVDKSMEVVGQNEAVGQVLHNVLASALHLSNDVTKLFIEARKENGLIFLQITDNSKKGFPVSFIENQDNLAYPHDPNYIGLILCKELVKDFDGSIRFDNLTASDGEIVGTMRTIEFINSGPKKRLSFVRKATKSELLKSFQS